MDGIHSDSAIIYIWGEGADYQSLGTFHARKSSTLNSIPSLPMIHPHMHSSQKDFCLHSSIYLHFLFGRRLISIWFIFPMICIWEKMCGICPYLVCVVVLGLFVFCMHMVFLTSIIYTKHEEFHSL